ncbi:hypothetical protein [Nonlabens tegetincola]|uniref:hypothetical protein n=1 Tax=Nonlabens tegetincola TaxID=323273 RepID=UPI0011B0D487|nr:hypothetical protein [Nonlabens tegetincola]
MKYLLLLFCLYGMCQEIKTPVDMQEFYGIDDFGALYYGKDQALVKKTTTQSTNYFDIQLGPITSVDLLNPLKIVVFYEDTQTVVILDNRLNEIQRVTLSTLNPLRFISKVQLAGDRRLWMLNADTNQIELYDYINNRIISSTPVIKGNIRHLYTDYNFCHVQVDNSLISFNTYGSKTSTLSLNGAMLAYHLEQLVIIQGNDVTSYNFGKDFRFRESETTKIPKEILITENNKSFHLKTGNLYIWTSGKIHSLELNFKK